MYLQPILISALSGFLFGTSWCVLADGIIQSHGPNEVAFMWYWALPAVFSALTNILMNFVDSSQITFKSSFSTFEDKRATAWFIVMLSGSFICIGGALWVQIQHYTLTNTSPWPGFSILLNTLLISTAGLLFFFARNRKSQI